MIFSFTSEALSSVDYAEYENYDLENDVDPETHVFSHIRDSCQYYTKEQVNNVKTDKKFSLFNLNCRSLQKFFSEIKYLLDSFRGRFMLIALSETWVNKGK